MLRAATPVLRASNKMSVLFNFDGSPFLPYFAIENAMILFPAQNIVLVFFEFFNAFRG